jgi:sialic acid synthase SpsE
MVARAFPPVSPYVIAAIDEAHDGRLSRAERLVDTAADAGCHAVKLIAPGSLSPGAWRTLRARCRGRIDLVLGVERADAVPIVSRLKPDAVQIDPAQLTNLALLRAVARLQRPVFLVVAMCTRTTLDAALAALGSSRVALLHTIAAKPLAPGRARLRTIEWLQRTYNRPVGYLGSEPDIHWSLVARVLGAVVIEHALTPDATRDGNHAAALEPGAMRTLVRRLQDLDQALEPVEDRDPAAEELDAVGAQALSLVLRRPLRRGAIVRASDLTATPPLRGLSPRLLDWVVGRRLLYDLDAGEPITFGLIE